VPAVRRFAAKTSIACACALALPAAFADAATAPVAVGDYKGAPLLDVGGSYQSAIFSVAKEAGKRTIVATEDFEGIFYPDVGECDDELLPLAADTVPISDAARFKVRDKATLDHVEILVIWKGRWTKAKRIAGTITIKSGDCTSTERWSARRLAKPANAG
jgi:hypothetical protein